MDELDRALQALMEQYAITLPARMAEIDAAWQSTLVAPSSTETLARFHLLVHRLTGSAGMYGFPELSRSARDLELAVAPLVERAAVPDGAQAREFAALVAALKDVYACSKQQFDIADKAGETDACQDSRSG